MWPQSKRQKNSREIILKYKNLFFLTRPKMFFFPKTCFFLTFWNVFSNSTGEPNWISPKKKHWKNYINLHKYKISFTDQLHIISKECGGQQSHISMTYIRKQQLDWSVKLCSTNPAEDGYTTYRYHGLLLFAFHPISHFRITIIHRKEERSLVLLQKPDKFYRRV
jgi:hypothetical protein